MYDCSAIKRLILPHLDRELDIKESLRVQAHLVECEDCREVLRDERAFHMLLADAFVPRPAPESVKQAVRDALLCETAHREGNRHRWLGLVSPGMLAAVVALALFFSLPHAHVPDVVKIALAEHRLYMKNPVLLRFRSSDPRAVTRWLESQLPFSVSIPPKRHTTVRLVGAGVRTGHEPAAVLTYLVDGAPVSLLVTAPRQIAFTGANARTFKNTVFHSAIVEGRHVLQWSDQRHTYVLVACRTTPVDALPFAVQTADGF